MKTRITLALLCTVLTLGAGAARAETNDDMSFSGMFKADRIDKNKDRMVSRAEFLEMMGKMWDMKAKEMGAKADRISMEHYQQVLMYLRAGS